MPLWQSAIAVPLAFLLALVACRVTGETDTTPVGAMGQVTQLTFGILSPGRMNVTLMAANITAGAASFGRLAYRSEERLPPRGQPRKQFLAQFGGIFAGTLVTVLCFQIMVPNPSYLVTKQFPAPAAHRGGRAEVLSKGVSSLEPIKVWSRNRRAGRHHPAAAEQDLPKSRKMDSLGRRSRAGLDVPVVHQPAVLSRRGHRLRVREKAPSNPPSSCFPWLRASWPADP